MSAIPNQIADQHNSLYPGLRCPRRWELAVLGIGVLIVFWKMHGFKLPLEMVAERIERVNIVRAQSNQPLLIKPKPYFLDSLSEWLRPWTWGRGDLLKRTTPTGGDFGAHVWLPDFIRRSLLPKARLTGWSNDFFGGFPAAAFYFPLPHLAIALLSFVLPYGVAFKVVSVSGICSLPFATHRLGHVAGLRAPAPLFMGLASFVFLLGQNYDLYIYGGSILPTMAGEFSFSISLSFGVLFLAQFLRLLQTHRGRRSTALLLACTGLSHLLPALFAVGVAVILLCVHMGVAGSNGESAAKTVRRSAFVFAMAAAVAAWWIVPFAANLPYTNDMGWEKSTTYKTFLFPFLSAKAPPDSQLIAIAFALALFGWVAAVTRIWVRRRRRHADSSTGDYSSGDASFGDGLIVTLGVTMIMCALIFRFTPQHRLWNARILPFWFLAGELLGACGAASLPRLHLPTKNIIGVLSIVIACGLPLRILPGWLPVPRLHDGLVGLQRARRSGDTNAMMSWTGHNFAGYESQAAWPEYHVLMTEASRVGKESGCGRAMWEHEEVRFATYGTTLALMLLPYWTKGCIASMDGIYFESSATLPQHWITAALVSAPNRAATGGRRAYSGPTNPQRNLPYPGFDLRRGAALMRESGVRYFIAVTEETERVAAAMSRDFQVVGRSGPYVFYRILGSELVTPAPEEPVVVTGVGQSQMAGWLDVEAARFTHPETYPQLLTASGPPRWRRIRARVDRPKGVATFGAGSTLGSLGQGPSRTLPLVKMSRIHQTNVDISFDVDRTGVPVVVHTSFHPNWKAHGASGPYRVMPNFMVVVPESKHVRIHYGYGTAERVGWMLSLGGACVLVAPAARLAMAWRRSWRRGHLPTAAQTDPMCEGDAPE